MQVAGDHLRLEAVEAAEVVDGALERLARLGRIEVADVLAHEDLPADGDGHRVLQVSAHGQHGRQVARRRAPAAAHSLARGAERSAPARHAHHRVVAGPRDRAVVHQEDVGDLIQPLAGLIVVDGDRLVAAIAAGGDDREGTLGHQQMVQRRIGKHHAQVGRGLRHVGRDPRSGFRRSSTIGAAARRDSSSSARHDTVRRATAREGIRSANGFSSRCLRCAQTHHCRGLRASTRSWNPPMPLSATISPRASASAARAIALVPSAGSGSDHRRGPQTGHAFG